jgi:hypothetical protein
MKKTKKSNVFLLSWDKYGIEAIIPLSEFEEKCRVGEQARLVGILSSPEGIDPGNEGERELGSLVRSLIMRAKFNTHRNYEIYSVHVDPAITETTLKELFESNPQQGAELIRAHGNKIYSDRANAKQVIT